MSPSASPTAIAPTATPEEAAAIAAAVELFVGETTPVYIEESPADPIGPWKRAALREGVLRAPDPLPFWA